MDDQQQPQDSQNAAAAAPDQPGVLDQLKQAGQSVLDKIGSNLDQQNAMIKSAMAGDENAQMAMARNSLGMAMGSLSPVSAAGPMPAAAEGLAQQAEKLAPEALNQNQLAAVQQKLAREIDFAQRRAAQMKAARGNYANGGRVTDTREIGGPFKSDFMGRYADGGEVTADPQAAGDSFKAMLAGSNPSANTEPTPSITQQPSKGIGQASAPQEAINMFNPDGKLVSIPRDYLDTAIDSGYKHASSDDVNNHFKQEQYGTPGQQAIAGLEGAGQGILGPLAPGAERLAGVNPEDIRGRAEANPWTHGLGEVAGLAGSMASGVGEGALAGQAGEGALKALGIGEGVGAASKIGSASVKSAVENMLIASSDEASRALTNDPNQSAETAMIDIGLGGLLGGAAGGALASINPLWKSTVGAKVGQVLDAFQKRVGGIEDVVPDSVNEAIQTAGIDVSPEVKAALSQDQGLRNMFQTLQESNTKSGMKAQAALSDFKSQVSRSIGETFGKSEDEINSLSHMSDYDLGTDLQNSIADQIKQRIEPIADKFSKIKERYSNEILPEGVKNKIATDIGDMANAEGYHLSPSSSQSNLISSTVGEIPNLKSLDDLRKYQSIIGDKTYSNLELRRVGGQLKSILRNAEDDTVMSTAGRINPDSINELGQARAAYKSSMDDLDSLNDRLHVGKYNGPGSFVKSLKEMAPEDVIRRLNPKSDAGLIGDLQNKFPEVADKVKNYQVSKILRDAANKAGDGEVVSPKSIFASMDKLTPEMKSFILDENQSNKLQALQKLHEGLPAKMNMSGTARTLDALWDKVPGSAVGMATLLTGHSPGLAVVLNYLTKTVAKDAPDAIRLATLKFLGSNKPISVTGFKTMADAISSGIKGESLLNRAAKNVFTAEKEVLPEAYRPNEKDRQKLDKAVKMYNESPQKIANITGDVGHYLPDHATAFSDVASKAINYLNSLRPSETRPNPLDSALKPNAVQKAAYNNALDLAHQPLLILDKIKKGNVTTSDIATIKSVYPALYNRLSNRLMQEVIDKTQKGVMVPYTTRMGLSMFTGQPLDSTMTPQGIQSAQMSSQSAQQASQQQPPTKAKKSTAPLSKMSSQYMTQDQGRESRRAGK